MQEFKNEWGILHSNIEKYERYSLLIKLTAVITGILTLAFWNNIWLTVFFILILWLQDGIWKTFQRRLEERILFIEKEMQNQAETQEQAYQFYTQWQNKRQGIVGLVKEYLANSLKPTVAYPYTILLVLFSIFYSYVR